jgi:hypothetical protein
MEILSKSSNSALSAVLKIFILLTRDQGPPFANLLEASDGNLWGTAESGGMSAAGTVFTLTPSCSFLDYQRLQQEKNQSVSELGRFHCGIIVPGPCCEIMLANRQITPAIQGIGARQIQFSLDFEF